MHGVRVVALFGLVVCALVSTLHAAANDKDRFQEAAKKLIDAINGGDHVECRGTRVDDSTIKAVQIQVENAPGSGGNGNGHH